MNQYLKAIQDLLHRNNQLTEQDKEALLKTIADATKQWDIIDFKLDRTEKVKRTTAILLEETISELENKRKAIEQQNRELEIESSLEKVRTVAMGMRKRDDMLDICRIISGQLELLGIEEIRNVQTAIFYRHKGTYINYEYYRLHDEALVTEVDYTNDEMSIEFAARMIKGADEVFVRRLEGQQVKDWLNIQKSTNVFIDTHLENAKSLTYYWFSLGPVAIGMSAYDPLSEEEIALFKRFRNVFDLAYRRYLDIEKAEAQAREAQIEAALEKIRSRSLAMHKSDELQEVVHAVFERLNELNFELDTAIIIIFTEGSKDTVWWLQNSANQQYLRIPVDYADISYLRNLFAAKDNKKDLPSAFYSLEQKNELLNYLFDHTDFRFTPPEQKESLLQKECATMSAAIAKNTAIHITRYFKKSFSENENEILKKFSNVFEQAYTRFLDLQKAEAQARESQIQLALERVRARTMAMQRSDELKDAAALLFQQVKTLGVPAYSCGYNIWEKDEKEFTSWMSTQDGSDFNAVPNIPLAEDANFIRFADSRQKGEQFFVLELRGERMQEHYAYLKTIPAFKGYFDYAESVGFDLPKTQIHHIANFSHGNLLFITLEPCPEFHDVFKRFAAVFEQTYTRFLDLQKAEAQAKESQIQLALERVRARTMAMQRSEELSDAVYVLFQQFRDLGENPDQATIGIINEGEQVIEYWVTMYGNQMDRVFKFPFDEPHVTDKIYKAWKGRNKSLVIELSGKDLYEFTTYRESMGGAKHNPEEKRRIINVAFFSKGLLNVQSNQTRSDESIRLLERFAAVFDQTYTRFLDLQKAEAQALESQIEAALERVRSRTMAMQHSDELKDAALLLFQQVQTFGVDQWACGYNIWEADGKTCTAWMSRQGTLQPPFKTHPAVDHCFQRFYDAKQKGESFYVEEIGGDEIKTHYKRLISLPEFKSAPKEFFDEFIAPKFQIFHIAYFDQGYLMFITYKPVPQTWDIFKRFAKVFEQTYTRFLDLQKAEAQAREAKIEAALERTRTQSMLMQHSKELDVTLRVFHEQVLLLGINSAFSFLWLPDEEKDRHIFWAAWAENNFKDFKSKAINYPLDRNEPATAQCLVDWKSNQPVISYHVPPGGVESYFGVWQELIAGVEELKPENFSGGLYYVEAFMKYGCFGVMVKNSLSEDEEKILGRFAIEFERTYTRFLDLQKAEAQARESQIELGLERVRARAMAMQKSDELSELVDTVFKELTKLDFALTWCIINIIDEPSMSNMVWAANPDIDKAPDSYHMKFEDYPFHHAMMKGWKERKTKYVYVLEGPEKKVYDEYLFNETEFRKVPEAAQAASSAMEKYVVSFSFSNFGGLQTVGDVPLSDANLDILSRFGKVFDLTYTRFNDLKQAEAQAREAQIETALERVRSRSMGMQKSEELKEVIQVVYDQFVHLNIHVEHTGFVIDYKTRDDYDIWIADQLGVPSHVTIPYFDCVYYNRFNEAKKKGEDFFATNLTFEEKNRFYKKIIEYIPGLPEETKEFLFRIPGLAGSTVLLDNVCLYIENFSGIPYSDEENNTLMRFGKVFQQTYTRFLDLQKAEAQGREAIKRASVDRVRAEIASMRTTNDLERITPLIWNELTTLGVPFVRCGVFIMDEEKQLVETHLSTPDGRAIASFTSTFSGTQLLTEILPYWQRKEIYKAHWDEARFLEQAKSLLEQGSITSGEKYLTENRPTDLYLHFLPFLQGMLYAGNAAPLSDDALQLMQNLADAFSTAYARYEDFNKLEAAKQQIEKTLVDLKQAQQQLVQSEKMASLGELTAGIAHEIQNPLNFVNNFSDVNKELLEELKEEADRGNIEEIKAIANDVINNEEKINHHGKRADAIVKNMLQHSRSSGSTKELTDINKLADEYLRLSYHGLRAKDKSFNADFKTELDSSIGKINVIPQDIGRVMLNLINNAFYAVGERQKVEGIGYEPSVTVSTKKLNDKVEIKVNDNGSGIPQKVLDKIFHPFFTTKPTGQGTGLGLSLSYDIIKTHGGEIKVETKEGEGSEFVIQLPV